MENNVIFIIENKEKKCSYCGRRDERLYRLKSHINTKTEDINSQYDYIIYQYPYCNHIIYECPYCNRKYKTKKGLKLHMNTHTENEKNIKKKRNRKIIIPTDNK